MTIARRITKETTIELELRDRSQGIEVATTVPFLDHMLATLARYAGLGLRLSATGDLRHHIIEDTAIVFGASIRAALPASCRRYGDRTIPMDDALVQCTLDAGGRPYYEGRLPSRMYEHWMRSFANNGLMTIHVRRLRGRDRHHVVEAAFKALGLALRDAMIVGDEVFSTKGAVAMTITQQEAP